MPVVCKKTMTYIIEKYKRRIYTVSCVLYDLNTEVLLFILCALDTRVSSRLGLAHSIHVCVGWNLMRPFSCNWNCVHNNSWLVYFLSVYQCHFFFFSFTRSFANGRGTHNAHFLFRCARADTQACITTTVCLCLLIP